MITPQEIRFLLGTIGVEETISVIMEYDLSRREALQYLRIFADRWPTIEIPAE
jgi:hypothetical protein